MTRADSQQNEDGMRRLQTSLGDNEDAAHARRCGGRVQYHPMSDDFGICAECGYESPADDDPDASREEQKP